MTKLTIEKLGAQGDGIATFEGAPLFVPFTLPGEEVEVQAVEEGRATEFTRLTASKERQSPSCQHFEVCGGCALQHMSLENYQAFKLESLRTTLSMAGIETEFETPFFAPEGARRRASFGLQIIDKTPRLSFSQKASITPVPLDMCSVVDPAIVAEREALAEFARFAHLHHKTRLIVTSGPNGLDVALSQPNPMTAPEERKAVAYAASLPFVARFSVNGSTVLQVRPPVQPMGKAEVTPPPGGFLQAVQAAEKEMTNFAIRHLRGSKTIADLFAGCGAFTFPLAQKAIVEAFESEAVAINALLAAAKAASGLRKILAFERDLYKEPVAGQKLRGFDGVVLDPPRAGAKLQVEAIVKNKVAKVVYVSCNPASFARDAKLMLAGGYKLTALKPIDQFLYTPHMELVAAFERA